MKKITIEIKDETADALDKVAQSYDYHKYPTEQAYGLIIDEMERKLQSPSRYQSMRCCYVPPHSCIPGWWI